MGLSRDDILNANDLETIEVDVPEWGGSVNVLPMTGAVREQYEKLCEANKSGGESGFRAMFISLSIVDDKGSLLFDKEDIKLLGEKSFKALNRVFEVATEINGMSPDSVEEAEKN